MSADFRLFVALELPGEVRVALSEWLDAESLSALRPVPPDSLHVTLCFLGSLPAGEAGAIGDACAGALSNAPAVQLALGDVAWLPRGRPQVLSVAVSDGAGELAGVQAAIMAALVAGGWHQPETRPFFAHITVGRVRRGEQVRAVELAGPPGLSFCGSRVTLFRSHPGSRYEPLATVLLEL
ncbi:MAG TPA: RNA 2',3'-cyclic phosphodiesterase [Solirubrobacteraceae bacterium]|nr:RNA 2',3'-cyclic phosphodiesterase [Solirubrobacteraceae bacterium]